MFARAEEASAYSLPRQTEVDTLPTMKDYLRIFSSFEEAEEADSAFYASLTPQERLDLLLDLIARHRESTGETAERFERVYRVIELSGS